MSLADLQVTYRGGRVLVAYYSLESPEPRRAVRTEEAGPGLLVDYGRNGAPMGIEIYEPSLFTLARFNRLLSQLGLPRVSAAEVAPLFAA